MKIVARIIGVFFSFVGLYAVVGHERSMQMLGTPLDTPAKMAIAILGAGFIACALVLIIRTSPKDF